MNQETRSQNKELEDILGIEDCVSNLEMNYADVMFMLDEHEQGVDIKAKYSDAITSALEFKELAGTMVSSLDNLDSAIANINTELERGISRKQMNGGV